MTAYWKNLTCSLGLELFLSLHPLAARLFSTVCRIWTSHTGLLALTTSGAQSESRYRQQALADPDHLGTLEVPWTAVRYYVASRLPHCQPAPRFALLLAATQPLATSHMIDAFLRWSTRDSRSVNSMFEFALTIESIALLFLRPAFSAPGSRVRGLVPLAQITDIVTAWNFSQKCPWRCRYWDCC